MTRKPLYELTKLLLFSHFSGGKQCCPGRLQRNYSGLSNTYERARFVKLQTGRWQRSGVDSAAGSGLASSVPLVARPVPQLSAADPKTFTMKPCKSFILCLIVAFGAAATPAFAAPLKPAHASKAMVVSVHEL